MTVFGSATANRSNWLEVVLDAPLTTTVLDELTIAQGGEPAQEQMEGFCI